LAGFFGSSHDAQISFRCGRRYSHIVVPRFVSSRRRAGGAADRSREGRARQNFNNDWSGLDALPGIKWAPLPPQSLQNCLPDGGCFARQGAARYGDHGMNVIASGARTFVTNIYFRSTARALGETNVLDALKQAGFAPELAR